MMISCGQTKVILALFLTVFTQILRVFDCSKPLPYSPFKCRPATGVIADTIGPIVTLKSRVGMFTRWISPSQRRQIVIVIWFRFWTRMRAFFVVLPRTFCGWMCSSPMQILYHLAKYFIPFHMDLLCDTLAFSYSLINFQLLYILSRYSYLVYSSS